MFFESPLFCCRAGGFGFTRGLLTDLLTVPEFHDIEVTFTDINPDNLRMVTSLCQRDIDENGLNIKIHATLDRREAFRNAKYVINCVRIGMLEAFATACSTVMSRSPKRLAGIRRMWISSAPVSIIRPGTSASRRT